MIKKKRESLENFIKEQIIGPGGCNYQYFVKREDDSEELESGFSYGEVLNTTPGTIYSSAILFPQKAIEDARTVIDNPQIDDDDSNENDEDTPNELGEELAEERNVDHSEDIDALGRRFPNKFGISCCLDENHINNNLKITVSGRYYKQVKSSTLLRIKIEDVEGFQAFIEDEKFKQLMGKLVAIDGDALKIVMGIKEKELKEKKDSLREINKHFCKLIATNEDNSLCDIYNETSFKPEYRFLSAYKERLFAKLNNFDTDNNYTCAGREEEIKNRISKVEKYETFISYIEDVISVFDSQGFGYWEAVNFEKSIDLTGINLTSKRVFKADEYPSLKDVVKVEVSNDIYLSLDVWLQAIKSQGKIYLKVLLVNSSTPITSEDVRYFSIVTKKINERSFFGVSINISSPYLLEYHKENSYDATDQEANALRYLYRNIKDYGVGHLCSVNWGLKDGVMNIWSEFLPTVETPDVEPVPRNKMVEDGSQDGKIFARPYLESPKCLQFKWLSVFSEAKDEDIAKELLEFVETYKSWIDNLSIDNNPLAEENRNKCEKDYLRIKNNIVDFLLNPKKMLAFRLMNAAMFMQLWHNTKDNKEKVIADRTKLTYDYYKNEADDTTIFHGMNAAWRPFQLAFILLNLDGIFQRNTGMPWVERNELVDLVWFPTGGGKTEAYLGIIALTIINRRRTQGTNGEGTAALMRYTLRLLTTQQFQRALRLIMALEQIRKWCNANYNLGNAEISIGLYLGSASLPNSNKDLEDETQNWQRSHGKVPLDTCPWCGSPIEPVKKNNEQHFRCKNIKCTFGGKNSYPVRLCDEHIYKTPPTLLFGTVDKFAQLAHKVDDKDIKKDSRGIFGINNNCLPPDLIIQDELHLLLGPLGSAVSLYECAIDQLCSRKDANGNVIRPKIISSTATTRNTALQIRALYDRNVSIFPKNGTDYDRENARTKNHQPSHFNVVSFFHLHKT